MDANTFALFGMEAGDLWWLLGTLVGAELIALLIFWVFYSGCSLAPGLSMRIGRTFGVVLFLIAIFVMFRPLTRYFDWWLYSPPLPGVLNDAILALALAAVWLVLMWVIWPRPRRQAGML